MPDCYGSKDGKKLWSDSVAPVVERDEKPAQPVNGGYNGGYGAAAYGGPVVQPLIFFPYGMFDGEGGEGEDFGFDMSAQQDFAAPVAAPKTTNKLAVLSMLFGLVAIIWAVVTFAVKTLPANLMFADGKGAIAWALDSFKGDTLIVAVALIASIALTVITFIISLVSMKKDYPTVGKIIAALALVAAIVAIVLSFVNKMTVEIGAYITVALTALCAIFAILARRKKKE